MTTFIVEGKNDKKKIESVLGTTINSIVLGGNKFNRRVMNEINEALIKGKVYILTDPDRPGDIAAARIQGFYKIKRIKINKNKAKRRKSGRMRYGIEYCNNNYLKSILSNYI